MLVNQADVNPDPERLTSARLTDSSVKQKSRDAEHRCESLLFASLDSRIYLLETAVKELHEIMKSRPNDLFLSVSDIQISPSTKNLLQTDSSAAIVPQDPQHPSYNDEPLPGRTTPRHMSSDSTVSRQSTSTAPFTVNPSPRRLSVVEAQDLHARIGQLNKKCKEMIRRNRIKIEEFDSKLSNLSDHVTTLRRTLSCDEAEVFLHSFMHFSCFNA